MRAPVCALEVSGEAFAHFSFLRCTAAMGLLRGRLWLFVCLIAPARESAWIFFHAPVCAPSFASAPCGAVGIAHGGGGGGAKMEPTAILVIKGERVELFNIKGSAKYSGFDRLIGMVPEVISKLKKDKYIYINENDGTTAK